jgi:hypothetical protein
LSKLAHILAHLFRQAQRLLDVLIGLTFLVLAAAGGMLAYQEWHVYQRTPAEGSVKFWVVAAFTLLLLILGLYSFAKARSVR